jgi:hypothetical protein
MAEEHDYAGRLQEVATHLSMQQQHNGPVTPWAIDELLAIAAAMNAPPEPPPDPPPEQDVLAPAPHETSSHRRHR